MPGKGLLLILSNSFCEFLDSLDPYVPTILLIFHESTLGDVNQELITPHTYSDVSLQDP